MSRPPGVVRALLLADLDEPLGPDARSPAAVLSWETVNALAELANSTGELEVDVVARRGSVPVAPLITADPDELAPRPPTPAGRDARQDAIYTQIALAGLCAGYDVVHALVPVVAPIQVLVSGGQRVCQTITVPLAHLSVALARVLPPTHFAQVEVGTQGPNPLRAVAPPVDLTRFRPARQPAGDYAVWSGSGGRDAHAAARDAAGLAGLPLRRLDEGAGDVADLLASAAVMLHTPYPPTPLDAVWPVRALACGTPVVSWDDPVLQRYCDTPGLAAFVQAGDAVAMAEAVQAVRGWDEARPARRAAVVAWSGRRQVAARYREVYAHLVGMA